MEYQFRKIRPLYQVLFILLTHGWWKLGGYWHYKPFTIFGKRIFFKVHSIDNAFGSGYWSLGKFKTCGRIMRGYESDGMFKTDVWDFQPMFVSKKTYYPSFYYRIDGISYFKDKK